MRTIHALAKAAAGYLAGYLEQPDQQRAWRAAKDYAEDLAQGLDHVHKAGAEADRFPDVAGGDGEADCLRAMHGHCQSADACLEPYRTAVTDNPEAEKARTQTRAFAAAIARGLH